MASRKTGAVCLGRCQLWKVRPRKEGMDGRGRRESRKVPLAPQRGGASLGLLCWKNEEPIDPNTAKIKKRQSFFYLSSDRCRSNNPNWEIRVEHSWWHQTHL